MSTSLVELPSRESSPPEVPAAPIFAPGRDPARVARLSLLFGGSGQLSIGQKKKGIVLIIASVIGLACVVVPGAIIIGLCVYDALVMARRQEDGRELGDWEFFWHHPTQTRYDWKVVAIRRLDISEEPIGVEYQRIDNSTSTAKVVRTLRGVKVWSCESTLEFEKATTTMKVLDPKLKDSSFVKHSVEDLQREQYNYTEGTTHTVEETIEVVVNGGCHVVIELHWKNIIDNWEIVLRKGRHETVVPFKVISKVTFDQRMVNVEDALAA